jgi:hypothetical protein
MDALEGFDPSYVDTIAKLTEGEWEGIRNVAVSSLFTSLIMLTMLPFHIFFLFLHMMQGVPSGDSNRRQYPPDHDEVDTQAKERTKIVMNETLHVLGADSLFQKLQTKLNEDNNDNVYTSPVPNFLMSRPASNGGPCKEQGAHYDYDLQTKKKKKKGVRETIISGNEMPFSCMLLLHGDVTHVVVYRALNSTTYDEDTQKQLPDYHKIIVRLNPGDMF